MLSRDARRTIVPSTLLAVSVVLLAGCSGQQGEQAGPSGAPAPSSVTQQASPAPDRTTVDDKGGVGAHKDLQKPACEADKNGVWGFRGSVKNATRDKQTYTVEVSVVNPDGWGVVGSKSIEVTAEPGETVPVEARGFHREKPADAAKHQCVTRVVRHAG